MKFNTIGIIVKPHSNIVKDTLDHLLDYLNSKSIVAILDVSAKGLANNEVVERAQLAEQKEKNVYMFSF